MTRSETSRKLRLMKLSTMADEYDMQITSPIVQQLPFEDRFQLLVDKEYEFRKHRKLNRLLRQSGISQRDACINDMYYGKERDLRRETVLRIGSCKFIAEHRNILCMGPTGCGKTYFSSAIGIEACKQEYTVRYVSLDDLIADIEFSESEHPLMKRTLKYYRDPDLLIIDEFLRRKLSPADADRLFHIIDYRSANRKSMMICSQFPCVNWTSQIDDPVSADAIVDRIIHVSYHVVMNADGKGKSMREVFGIEYSS